MRPIRDARTSTLIAAYRKEPAFAGDITWEMAIAVTPLDKRPCQVLWDEGTVRYHIAPFQTSDGRIEWHPYCQEGAKYLDRNPIFLVGLGSSNYTEEQIWSILKGISFRPRVSYNTMYKDWVWDVLPVSSQLSSLCPCLSHVPQYLADAEAIYARYGRRKEESTIGVGLADPPVMNMLGHPVARRKNGIFMWRF